MTSCNLILFGKLIRSMYEIHPINTVNLCRKSHLASLNTTHLSNTRFVPENKKSAKSKKFKSDFEFKVESKNIISIWET